MPAAVVSWVLVCVTAAPLSRAVPPHPQIMEVASPTAGSVLVELSQLQLLQACQAVAVRTMLPHGESADSLLAPVARDLAEASRVARVPCASPQPGREARPPLAAASPGLVDSSSPLRCPDRRGAQEPPGAPPSQPSQRDGRRILRGAPSACLTGTWLGGGWPAEAGRRARARAGGPSSVPAVPGAGWGGCAGCSCGREGQRACLGRLRSWPCYLLCGQGGR